MKTNRITSLCVVAGLFLPTLLLQGALSARQPAGGTTAVGRVFLPNPVAFLQDQTLTDEKDAEYPALAAAYQEVVLTDLDGSGYLRGAWATVRSSTGPAAWAPDGVFVYGRDDDRFEQVMAYYWVTEAQKYIQSLGFGTIRRPIDMEPQDVRLGQWGVDNSYSWDKHDVLRFGKGGVDDAEDAEVILHEYGHAMMDSQATPFGSFGYTAESGAIGEGFSDYWAVEVTSLLAPTPDPACVADWDSVSYTAAAPHCLRRVDLDLYYPDDLTGEVHHDGLLWSRALWDVRAALPGDVADTLILESHFGFDPETTMPAAAEVTVATADALYGAELAALVQAAFEARGILVP